jgi:alpha-glucosidase
MDPGTDPVRFERVDSVAVTERGLLARLHRELLGIDVVRADVVRLRISRGGVFDESPTASVAVDPLGEPVECEVQEAADVVRVRTSALVVSLWREPFRLDVHRTDGSPVIESAPDARGRWWTFATLNDAFWLRRRRRPADVFHGLGEKTGPADRSGRDYTLWNTDVLDPRASGEFARTAGAEDPRGDNTSTSFDPYYISIPFLHHQDGASGAVAGSFVDNAHRAHYDLTRPDEYRIAFAGGQYVEYVFAGPRMPDVVSGFTWLTGRMAPPPLWALGYHQCRWHPYTQDDVLAIGRRLRDAGIPCDALWLDIDHMDGYRVFTWDPQRFPDPASMLAELAAAGLRLVTIVDPGIKHEPGYPVFDDAVARNVLCRTEGGGLYLGQVWPGLTAFPDFTLPEARAWWGRLNAQHVRSGIAGIWNDMNEPATGGVPPEAMRFDRGRASHGRHHNQYALLMAMGTVDGLRAAQPERRTFVLSRAGSAGIQRYAANWLGDNFSRWDHLAMSIPMATGLGLSGQPFVGADIGGFMGECEGELLVRWAQYGALTPFCRNHAAAWTPEQYPWSFGPEVQELVGDAIRLRYRLMPYLYAAFVRAAETGAPVQRPLDFDHQDDRTVRALDDQYLLGPDLLVAPVASPGVTARPVRLPEGDWYEWHTGEPVEGRDLLADAPADRIPVFARGGAVIPMWPDAPDAIAGHQPAVVELHVYVPRSDGTRQGLLQEDDGATMAAATADARVRTDLEVTRAGDRVTVTGTATGRGYPEFARTAFRMVLHGARPTEVRHDGALRRVTDGVVVLPNAGASFHVEFDA